MRILILSEMAMRALEDMVVDSIDGDELDLMHSSISINNMDIFGYHDMLKCIYTLIHITIWTTGCAGRP